jgi:hypothetical protein
MTETSTPTSDVTARASAAYRIKNLLVVLMLVGWGVWSIYDGFVNWPRQNQEAVQKDPNNKLPHSELDVLLNKILGIALPPLGLLMLAWVFHRSRGEYRLSGTTLHVPGHPPVPLDNIRRIDKKLWDRKGIALIDYEIPDCPTQQMMTLKLDDFIYEREGTDEILRRIEHYLIPAQEASEAQPSAPTPPPA